MTAASAGLLVVVAAAAAIGACLRFATDQLLQRRIGGMQLPWGTLTANSLGSLVLGVSTGLALRGSLGPELAAVIGTGLCGGYTTFSTWTYETLRLVEDGDLFEAATNVGLNLVLGLGLAGVALITIASV